MTIWDKNTTLFRIIIAVISIFLLVLVTINFVRTITTKTDQNLYAEPPSRYYITKSFEAEISDWGKKITRKGMLNPGNLIIKVNDSVPENVKVLYNLINETPEDKKIKFLFIDNKDINKDFVRRGFFTYKVAKIEKSKIPEDFILFLSSAVIIGHVEKDGASDRAGVQIGDYIVKVNGESFKTALEANKFVQESEKGSYLTYDILRDNNFIECKVEIAKYEISFNYLILFIIGLVYFAFGIFLAESRPNFIAARFLGLAFILIGYYISAFLIPLRMYGHFQYHIYFLFTLSTAFGFPVLVHGLVHFPRKRIDMLKAAWVIKAPYIYGILFTLTAIVNIFVIHSMVLDKILFSIIQTSIPLFLLYYFIVFLIFKKSRIKEEAGLSKLINVIFFFLLILAIAATLLSISGIYILNIPFHISLVLIPFAFIYTIGRYRLFNLEFRIRKNIQYILISIIWKTVLLFLIFFALWQISQFDFHIPNLHFTGASIEVLDNPLSEGQQDIYHNICIIILSLAGAFIFRAMNKKGQKYLNKKYYRTRFDYRKATTDFSEILDRNISINALAENIISELAELVHLKKAGIIFYKNEDSVIAENFYGFNSDSIIEYCRVTANKQISYIRQFKSEFRVDYLDEPMREIYQKCEFRYLIPIRSKEKIVGALLVGDKMSEVPYHRDDLEFLNTITGQIAAAVENAFLYEELTHQERIKHELELARRIQLASLPQSTPDIDGLDVSGISIPAHEVGGDFFDYLTRNGELTVIVGDVSGKGTSAALYMSKAQGIMRTLHEFNLSPKELFERSNQLLYKYLEKSSFITAICANINSETKTLKISRAGHLPMYYYNSTTEDIKIIHTRGIVLGITKSKLFSLHLEERQINFNSGDVFLLVTDGVIDARNPFGNDYQTDRLLNTLKKNAKFSSELIKREILESLKEFTGSSIQFDDITIVVIKIL
ncbi:SpoIIE family protein phosphatase [Bacteroidota bacterium]